MDGDLNCGPPPVTGGDLPSRKRGRPPITVSPEVLVGRIMSRQRANASRPKAKDGDLSKRKRGRPPITLTKEILERRRMLRQRVNASRPKPEGPAKKRGRPKRAAAEVILESHPLSRPVVPDSCEQGDASSGTSQTLLLSDQNPPTTLGKEPGPFIPPSKQYGPIQISGGKEPKNKTCAASTPTLRDHKHSSKTAYLPQLSFLLNRSAHYQV